MKKLTKSLLEILKDVKLNRKTEIEVEDFHALYELSKEHEVGALVYNQIYRLDGFPSDLKQRWSLEAIKTNASQAIKTQRFLKVYKSFLEQNIKVIVVKGLVCRSLYPEPDNRPSNDEDLYIEKKDKEAVTKIFLDYGFELVDDGEEEIKFLDLKSGLSIELHLSLFPQTSKAYGQYQLMFQKPFQQAITHSIMGVDVYSLSYDQHLLFLILHFTKHFLHGGVGIRQLLDIAMYTEAYAKQIHWDYIFQQLEHADLVVFMLNAFEICHACLGLDETCIDYGKYSRIQNEYQDLLEDIIESGIFGQTSQERIHSSTITLNAMEKGKVNVLKSVFPSLSEMKGKFPYLNDKPYLLPVAQATRILNYVKNNNQTQSKKTVELGNQRVDLLKKYKMMKD